METVQITKDLQKTLRTLIAQTEKVVEMVDRKEDVKIIYHLLLATMALCVKACSTQFIHLLRNDATIKSDLLHLNKKLTEAQSIELDVIDKNMLNTLFAGYASVFKQFERMEDSFE